MEFKDGWNNRVLIVGSQEGTHRDFREMLSSGSMRVVESDFSESLFPDFVLIHARSREEAYEEIKAAGESGQPICLVFMDARTPPGMDSVEAARRIREIDRDVEIVIVNPYTDKPLSENVRGTETLSKLLYIREPLVREEVQQIALCVAQKWNVEKELEDLRGKIQQLEVQATHDSLTGLWDRTAIFDILQSELECAQRENSAVGVIILDFDHFKDINDTYGHTAGDLVLRESADRMRSIAPREEIGRYGGDEFLIVLSECDRQSALSVSEKVCACISNAAMNISQGMIPVTISLGVTVCSDLKGVDVNSLIRAADAALYRAKNSGRNRVEFSPVTDVAGR